MSVTYLVQHSGNDRLFNLSYADLRTSYRHFVSLSDDEFIAVLPCAAHLACVIAWLKELSPDAALGDLGIVHRLVHLMTDVEDRSELEEIREQFRNLLELV